MQFIQQHGLTHFAHVGTNFFHRIGGRLSLLGHDVVAFSNINSANSSTGQSRTELMQALFEMILAKGAVVNRLLRKQA